MTRLAFAALAVAFAFSARAGIVVQYEDDEKKLTTLELEGKKLRANSQAASPEGRSTIFDGDAQVLYSLDDEARTYRRMDRSTGDAIASAMEKARARMSPEQRAQMEALMGKQGMASASAAKEDAWRFERAAGGGKVAGYACDNYRILHEGKLQSEGCFVPWGTGALRKDDFLALHEMGRFFEKTYGSILGRTSRGTRSDMWVTHFFDASPGFPAVMDQVDDSGKRKHEMRLVKIDRASLAASRFVPPPGYREEKMPGGGEE